MALMERAKNILFQPKQEWPVIDVEQTSVGALYTGYIIPLAAIGPVASLIGWSVLGMRLPFVGAMKIPIGWGLRMALVRASEDRRTSSSRSRSPPTPRRPRGSPGSSASSRPSLSSASWACTVSICCTWGCRC